jgi:peptide/nickel transport system permease protein
MGSMILRRFSQYAVVLLIAITLNFFLPRMMPGNPLALILGESVRFMSSNEIDTVIKAKGLDKPLWEQYLIYLNDLAHGNLGNSYLYGAEVASVSGLLAEKLKWTLLLTGTSLVLSTSAGIALGVWSAWHRGRPSDLSLLIGLIVMRSIPVFWIAMILIAVFGVEWHILPFMGSYSLIPRYTGVSYLLDVGRHLILPLTAVTLVSIPGTYMVTRYSMLNILNSDFIMVARAKGLSERALMYSHALRNALLPIVTIFMLNASGTISGATVVETVFSYPGVGRMMYEAVLRRDYPLLQGGFLVITVAVIIGNILADLAYPLVDPRVRIGGKAV